MTKVRLPIASDRNDVNPNPADSNKQIVVDTPPAKQDDVPPPSDTLPATPPVNDSNNDDNQTILIDDKEYKYDANGNALNDDGTIYMTKEQITELETAGEVNIADLEKLSGIEIFDENGQKIQYDLTLESLAKRESDIKKLGYIEASKTVLDNFFASNPDIHKLYIQKQNYGTLENVTPEPVYSNLQLDITNEAQLKNIIIAAEVKKGKTNESAKRYAEYCKAENTLVEESKAAHTYLISDEQAQFKQAEDRRVNERKLAIEQDSKIYGTYYDDNGKEIITNTPGSIYHKIVTEGKFGNFVIPMEGIKITKPDGTTITLNRRQVFDYVATPVLNGKTQAELDEAARLNNIDYRLQRYMLNLTGNKMDTLIERAALEQRNNQIKKTLSTSKSTVKIPNTASKKVVLPVTKK
ncbi:hypothetical protein DSECCO2_120200 [anaerobic digester metagenome]